jgi:hypothetical protein
MTLIVIAAVFVVVLVWVYVAYRRDLRRIPAPAVEPSRASRGDLLGSDLDTWIAAQGSGR